MMRPVTLAYPPLAPTNLVVGAPTGNGNNRSVLLTWDDNSVSETNWVIERATNLMGPWTALATIPSDPLNAALTDTTGQSKGPVSWTDTIGNKDAFAYRVQAINVVGDTWDYADPAFNALDPLVTAFPTVTTRSAFSNIDSWLEAPLTPTGLVVMSVTTQGANNNRISLAWQDVANESGYRIQRATDPNFTQNVVTFQVGANATTYTNTAPRGVPGVTTYYYRIQSYNALAESPWSGYVFAVTI